MEERKWYFEESKNRVELKMSSPSAPPAIQQQQSSSSSYLNKQPLSYQLSVHTMNDPNAIIHQFVTRQKELLDLELKWEQTEEGEEEEKMGTMLTVRSLHKLQVLDVSIGLYGRTIVTLETAGITHTSRVSSSSAPITTSKLLPAHKLSVGDDVIIIPGSCIKAGNSNNVKRKTEGIAGVIHEITDCSISIALHSNVITTSNDDTCETLSLTSTNVSVIPSSSIATHNKMISALEELLQHGVDHPVAHTVVHKMFTNSPTPTSTIIHTKKFFNPNLDASQRQAIQFALSTNDVALIHGPPGTGKTTAVVELIQQAVIFHGWKVLLCAPSNIAVDNVLERLVSSSTPSTSSTASHKSKKLKVVRIGHPARISNTEARKHSLEALVNAADETEIVNDCKKELKQSVKMMIAYNTKTNAASSLNAQQRKKMKLEINSLRKEIRTREEAVVSDILFGANVVCSTNVGASTMKKPKFNNQLIFDLVIIDEAAQALEASCWIPALCGRRLVLVGDHRQLPPTIRSPKVTSELGLTMFDRAMKIYDCEAISRMLTVQYRMHKDISDWSSKAMYHGKLVPAESVAQWTLKDLSNVSCNTCLTTDDYELINTTLLLIDTAGCDMEESLLSSGSRFNEGEASVVQNHVERLLIAGLYETDIAIITPYNGQVEILRTMLLLSYPKLEIRSVDGFQGCEKEAVILSLVRSNTKGEVGFLADDRRLNVAVTRARKQCTIVCNTETVSNNRFIKDLIQWFEDKGDYRSALEFISGATTTSAISTSASASYVADKEKLRENLDPTKVISLPRKEDMAGRDSNDVSKLSLSDSKREQSESEGIVKPKHTHHEEPLQDRSLVHQEHLTNTTSSDVEADAAREEQLQFSALPKLNIELAEESCADNGKTAYSLQEDRRLLQHLKQSTDASNQLLVDLSQERLQRIRLKTEEKRKIGFDVKVSCEGRVAKSKGKRLGGEPKSKVKAKEISKQKVDAEESLDDMEFLEKQIAEVQNSHGRIIEGSGSTYKAIVNGILLSRPKRTSLKATESKASQALKEKLRQAEESRKVKAKKKGK